MRMRSFNAPTMGEAMALVRGALGDDAIIISTYTSRRGRGVEITAAVEEDLPPPRPVPGAGLSQGKALPAAGEAPRPEMAEQLARALAWHAVPRQLNERLTLAAMGLSADDPELALAGAIDLAIDFTALPASWSRPIMLIGQSGAGKTVTAAKLATRLVMAGQRVRIITTDTVKAGGVEQLSAFATLLDQPVETIETPGALREAAAPRPGESVIIDTPGTNPFNDEELSDLKAFVDAAGAEPVLVIPAGGDAAESADMAAIFARLAVRRLIATRLDASRRFGGVLAAAEAGGLALSDVGVSPFVAQGLHALNPVSLARLLLKDPLSLKLDTAFVKAAE